MIYAGLASDDSKTRATSRELLDNVVPESLRAGLLPLVDDLPELKRLELAALFFEPPGHSELLAIALEREAGEVSAYDPEVFSRLYFETLHGMVRDKSRVLRSVAQHHAETLGVTDQLTTTGGFGARALQGSAPTTTDERSGEATDPAPRAVSGA